jgi:AAA family ATP:ADP antiporter
MTEKRAYRFLRRFVDVRPEEAVPVLLLFGLFFLVTSSAYVVKPVKISAYLHFYPSSNLPYAYLLTAVLIGILVPINNRLLQRLQRLRYISISTLGFLLSFGLFWVLFRFDWAWVALLYWFWADLFIITSVFQFWVLVNDIFHPRQAKRLIGFFVSGGILGGILGALLTSRLARVVGTTNLLLLCPVFLGLGLALLRMLRPYFVSPAARPATAPEGEEERKTGYGESLRLIRRHRYLRLLSGIIASGIAVTTLLDFQFNAIVERAFPSKDARTSFLGTFLLGLLVFSYLLNALLSSRAVRSFGLQAALLITPGVLLLGSAAIFAVPAAGLIYWAVTVKGLDKSLAHTLHQSVRELLYIPVPAEIKYKAKAFIDMFVNKLADAVVALILILFVTVLHRSVREVSFLVLGFIVVWAAFAVLITREYVQIVKRHLKLKWQEAGRLVADKIDVDMTKLVFDTLESRKRSSVLYAMNMFDLIRREKLSPELRGIIAAKSDQVQASSLDSLLGVDGEPLFPEVDDSLAEESLDAEVQEVMSLDVYQQMMTDHLHKVAAGTGDAAEVERMEAAKALGLMSPGSNLVRSLRPLLQDASVEVAGYALDSAAKLKRLEFVPLIVRRLGQPALEQAAAKTLTAYGDRIVGTLKDYLCDPAEEDPVRRNIPGVLAEIGTQRAADLLASVIDSACGFESETLAGAAHLRGEHPEASFPEPVITRATLRLIRRGYDLLFENDRETRRPGPRMTTSELESALTRNVRDVFNLLGLVHPPEDIRRAFQNLSSGSKKGVEYSLELLDAMLKREVKQFLLPLIDDAPLEDRARKCRKLSPLLNNALEAYKFVADR